MGTMLHCAFAYANYTNRKLQVLGGAEPLLWTEPMQYTPSLHDGGWFTVQMLDLQIAGGTIGTDKSVYNRGKGVIVDSGTTDTYMPTGCAAGFKARWKEVRVSVLML
jgi:Eukaryotic aspartyl protease